MPRPTQKPPAKTLGCASVALGPDDVALSDSDFFVTTVIACQLRFLVGFVRVVG
ncbi:hypothetical protein [Microbacterium sp. NPDC087665]|uniref:hypothetical protein n=1 Tax=Microbacterium sp. NPDC087665 TaxID=3364194 RepID=UPI0037FD2570